VNVMLLILTMSMGRKKGVISYINGFKSENHKPVSL